MPITQRGFQQVSRKLKTLDNFQKWATKPVEDSVEVMYEQATTYAPDFAGNTYTRTGRLKRSMTKLVRATGNSIVGTVYGAGARSKLGKDYTALVKVEGKQARVHERHGWQTDADDLKKSEGKIDSIFKKAVGRALR